MSKRILLIGEVEERASGNEQPATPPRAHILERAPAKVSDRLAAIVVFTTSRGFDICQRYGGLLFSFDAEGALPGRGL